MIKHWLRWILSPKYRRDYRHFVNTYIVPAAQALARDIEKSAYGA